MTNTKTDADLVSACRNMKEALAPLLDYFDDELVPASLRDAVAKGNLAYQAGQTALAKCSSPTPNDADLAPIGGHALSSTPMTIEPQNKLCLEWIQSPDGMALFFDSKTWKIFQDTAHQQEQSTEHMILRAVVGCLGSILEDNMVLNRILPGSG